MGVSGFRRYFDPSASPSRAFRRGNSADCPPANGLHKPLRHLACYAENSL